MSTVEKLLDKAYQKLDSNTFTGARDDYRLALLLCSPTDQDLFNLQVAEQTEALIFRQSLQLAHPDSFVSQLAEADYLVVIGREARAVKLYSEILESMRGDLKNVVEIRSKRFHALCRGYQAIPNYETLLLDDFRTLWEMGEAFPHVKVRRQALIGILVKELQALSTLSVFDSLAQEQYLPASVKALIETKILQLKAFSDAIEDIKIKHEN